MQNFGGKKKIMKIYQQIIKPISDFALATIILVLISPILILVCLLLLFYNGRAGVFFCQPRPGYKEKIIKIIKFKTMNEKRDSNGKLLPDIERITPIGRIIRKTSIDELPQLFNILKGEMSFIGPRPLLPEYLPLYSTEQRKRHNVKPGISGWAQVNGRNNLSWKERFENDVYYAKNISFKLDLKILILSIYKILRQDDIQNNNCKKFTVEPFNGHN